MEAHRYSRMIACFLSSGSRQAHLLRTASTVVANRNVGGSLTFDQGLKRDLNKAASSWCHALAAGIRFGKVSRIGATDRNVRDADGDATFIRQGDFLGQTLVPNRPSAEVKARGSQLYV